MEVQTWTHVDAMLKRLSSGNTTPVGIIEISRDTLDGSYHFWFDDIKVDDIKHVFWEQTQHIKPATSTRLHGDPSIPGEYEQKPTQTLVMRVVVGDLDEPTDDNGNVSKYPRTDLKGSKGFTKACRHIYTEIDVEEPPWIVDLARLEVLHPLPSTPIDSPHMSHNVRYHLDVFGLTLVCVQDKQGVVHTLITAQNSDTRPITAALLPELWKYKEYAGHPMMSLLAGCVAGRVEVVSWFNQHGAGVLEAMANTGHYQYSQSDASQSTDVQELGRLSAVLGGHTIQLAKTFHGWEGLFSIANGIARECEDLTPNISIIDVQEWRRVQRALIRDAKYRADAAFIQGREAVLWQQHASTQMQAYFNLIAQRDANQGIALAKASREVAEASKRDSSSMKAIAAVTMFFLPGTFLASLFAVPMFNWNSGNGDAFVSPKIWVYFAFMGPITLLTVFSWLSFDWTINQSWPSFRTKRQETKFDIEKVKA